MYVCVCVCMHVLMPLQISYVYNDRLFGFKHFGIEKFQKKWRDYYKRKIQHYSNPKNIRYREIYGKFY